MAYRSGPAAATSSMVLWVLGIWMGLSPPALGDVLRVPEDFATIQEAIDASADGDEVVIAGGTYFEFLVVEDKVLVLRSADIENLAVLDGNWENRKLLTVRSSAIEIVGLVLQRTGNSSSPFVIVAYNSDVVCRDSVFRHNQARLGSCINVGSDKPQTLLVERCRFEDNAGGYQISTLDGIVTTTVVECTFDLSWAGGIGGASELTVDRCRFSWGPNSFGTLGIGAAAHTVVRDSLFQAIGDANQGVSFLSARFRDDIVVQGCVFRGVVVVERVMNLLDVGTVLLTGCSFVDCISGDALVGSTGTQLLDIIESVFVRNRGTNAGALRNNGSEEVRIAGSSFCDNSDPTIMGDWTDLGGNRFLDECCPADLSASSNPDSIFYGVPDMVVDSHDFFFYLDAFVNGDEVADIDGDGDRDADDFFAYLDRFSQGC